MTSIIIIRRPVFRLLTVLALFMCPLGWGDMLTDLTQWEEGKSMWSSSARRDKDGRPIPTRNGDCINKIKPGKTYVLADLQGPGVIRHIWITIYSEDYSWARKGWSPDGTANPQEVLLRMYWDGRDKPDVEAPLGDFFASGFGRNMEVISLPVVVEDGDSYNCYWQMPFRKAARIEVVNQSEKPIKLLYYNVDWVAKKKLPKNTMYFCAQYRQEYPVQGEQEYTILEAEGNGYYVGTVLSVRTRSPGWFGEGDARIIVDGDMDNILWGTGTEDYFLSAWGLKECSTPYFGVPYLNQGARDSGQMTCSYRWHIRDPLVFNKSIKVAIETLSWLTADENEEANPRYFGQRRDDYSSVAFWYQMGPSKKFAKATTAKERKLPSLDKIVLFAPDFAADKYHAKGDLNVQKKIRNILPHITYTPEDPENAWMEFPFEVKKKEPLRLVLVLSRNHDRGIWQPYLNGVKLRKPIDLHKDERSLYEYHIMDFWPEPGIYTLRLECKGMNKYSGGYRLGIDSIRLQGRLPRVEKFGLLKDHDWKKEQILYQRARPGKEKE
jgi:D-arabinan exo alpha-(1,3)/(1,5)-arabinofuranosidase (non-reducing end)